MSASLSALLPRALRDAPGPVVAVVRAWNPSDLALARALHAHLHATASASHLSLLTSPDPAPSSSSSSPCFHAYLRAALPGAAVHPLLPPAPSRLRHAAARLALRERARHVVLPTTRVDAALAALARIDAAVPAACAAPQTDAAEMLPPGLLAVHEPLRAVDEAALDELARAAIGQHPRDLQPQPASPAPAPLAPQQRQQAHKRRPRTHPDNASSGATDSSGVQHLFAPHLPIHAATAALGSVPIDDALRFAATRAADVSALAAASDDALRRAVVHASHWGFVVIRRSALAPLFADGRGGRVVVNHALSRLLMHVSGSSTPLAADDEQVARLAADLLTERRPFRTSSSSSSSSSTSTSTSMGAIAGLGHVIPHLPPVPKGRTVAGVVVRPATGRFARRILQQNERDARRAAPSSERYPEHLHNNRDHYRDRRHRPARGFLAGSPSRNDRRRPTTPPNTRHIPDDLVIITREPDHESGGLLSTRLRGNAACAPLTLGSSGVYWDNRFVMMASSVNALDGANENADLDGGEPVPPFDARDVFLAALDAVAMPNDNDVASSDAAAIAALRGESETGTGGKKKGRSRQQRSPRQLALLDADMYVRQLRRSDWELITASSARARDFQVPYECIRALPGVFRKPPDSDSLGRLVASPHLGLSSRADLCFTAVRVPRFRSLPPDMDPGFSELDVDNLREARPPPSREQARNTRRGGSDGRGVYGIRAPQQESRPTTQSQT